MGDINIENAEKLSQKTLQEHNLVKQYNGRIKRLLKKISKGSLKIGEVKYQFDSEY